MSTCSELSSKLTASWEYSGIGNPVLCQTVLRKLHPWGLEVIFLDLSFKKAGYTQLNLRSLLLKVRGVSGWSALPHKVVSPPAWGVCKQSLSLAGGISIFCGRLDEMITQAGPFQLWGSISWLLKGDSLTHREWFPWLSLEYQNILEYSNIFNGHSSMPRVSETIDDFPAGRWVQGIIKIGSIFLLGLKFPALIAKIGT